MPRPNAFLAFLVCHCHFLRFPYPNWVSLGLFALGGGRPLLYLAGSLGCSLSPEITQGALKAYDFGLNFPAPWYRVTHPAEVVCGWWRDTGDDSLLFFCSHWPSNTPRSLARVQPQALLSVGMGIVSALVEMFDIVSVLGQTEEAWKLTDSPDRPGSSQGLFHRAKSLSILPGFFSLNRCVYSFFSPFSKKKKNVTRF